MKTLYYILVLCFLMTSCSPFSTYSKNLTIRNCDNDSIYQCLNLNSKELKFTYKTFGAIKISRNNKDYKKEKPSDKVNFKNIIAFGKSRAFNGHFFLLLNNTKFPKNYHYKDTIINNRKLTIAVSQPMHSSNHHFMINGFSNK